MNESPDRELTEGMKTAIADELLPGERLVWAGRPLARSGCSLKALVIFGVLPLVIGPGLVAWAIWDQKQDARIAIGMILGIPGLVLTLVGSWAYSVDRRFRNKTFYILTDRRAVGWTAELSGKVVVQSFYPEDLGSLHRKEYPDGSGDLILQERMIAGHKGQAVPADKAFANVPRVHDVEQLVRETLLKRG